jgi:hypothetical protein
VSTQYWTSWVGEPDERCTLYASEAEAAGEAIAEIDANYEPGESIEYTVAPMLSAHEVLRGMNVERMGERIALWLEDWLSDEMMSDDSPLKVTNGPALHKALGDAAVAAMCAHTVPAWWVVDSKRQRKASHVAGSEDDGSTT